MLEASNEWLKPLGKEIDGKYSPSSSNNAHCRERAEAIFLHHDLTSGNQKRYKKTLFSNSHFDYKHVAKNEHRSWNQKTCSFVDYITMYLLSFGKEWQRKRG